MKAIVQGGYGSPDTLKLREIETPAAGDNGVKATRASASGNRRVPEMGLPRPAV